MARQPVLLAGGNPQIAKGEGDAPVQAYIAAMPGWKSEVGRRLDALVERAVPGVRKAVKWNSPLYGVEGQGWFLSFHCCTSYIKLAFFRGAALDPLPPVASKDANTRYFHIHEGDALDEMGLLGWFRQASALPGWMIQGGMDIGRDTMATDQVADEKSPSERIDERIAELGDWRGEMLARLRALIHEADPDVVEEWKWRGVPVWYHDGMICTGETYKKVVKLTFLKGAALDDPAGLFNASLEGNARRAIDVQEGETIDEAAFKALVRAAVALNQSPA